MFLWEIQEPPGGFYNWYISVGYFLWRSGMLQPEHLTFFLQVLLTEFEGITKQAESGTLLSDLCGMRWWNYRYFIFKKCRYSCSFFIRRVFQFNWRPLSFQNIIRNTPFFKLNTLASLFYCSIRWQRDCNCKGKAVHAPDNSGWAIVLIILMLILRHSGFGFE